ncbi:MAG: sigma-70 family RNA polymerase sigma factor [Saprospiraceae bacterium]|nr:sigma-70 family RNA polymerase sigma factor [Saprospiraceae bacterium]
MTDQEIIDGLMQGGRRESKAIMSLKNRKELKSGMHSLYVKWVDKLPYVTEDDVYYDAVIRLKRSLIRGNFKGENFNGYFYKIFRNALFEYLEKDKTQLEVYADEFPEHVEHLIFSNLNRKATEEKLSQKMALLKEGCKEILELFFQEYKMAEITQIIGATNKGSVKAKKSKCLDELRSLMGKDDELTDLIRFHYEN